MAHQFSAKQEFVLKALSMSRGRLAADLGVDKSAVGRWVSGAVKPSAHSLSKLTALVAANIEGFTVLDWERSLESVADQLGVDPKAVPGSKASWLADTQPMALLDEILDTTARRGLRRLRAAALRASATWARMYRGRVREFTMQSQSFSEKLTLVLKSLSMTRGHLAAEMGVDKSIVGRWMTGRVAPSNHDMVRLTELVASRAPGFRLIDWERDIGGIEALLGVAPANTSSGKAARLPPGLPIRLMDQIMDATALRAGAYEGYFRSTRPYAQRPGHFIHDQIMMRLDETGLLRLYMGTGGVLLDGWVLPVQSKLFVVASELTSGALGLAILNGVNTARAGVMDGILLNCSLDAGLSPTACAIVVERTGDLIGDIAGDDLRIRELAKVDPFAPRGSVPEAMAAHLARDIGPAQLAVGGDWLLSVPLARSLARGIIPG